MYYFDPDSIKNIESSRMDDIIERSRLPTPSGPVWAAICAKFPEAKATRVDSVLSDVVLPNGWTVKKNTQNRGSYLAKIFAADMTTVGEVTFKNSGYDYRGHTCFFRDPLVRLGIIETTETKE